MTSAAIKTVLLLLVLGAAGALGWTLWERLQEHASAAPGARSIQLPTPVEVAPIERGRITARRTLSGSLEATESFVVASRVGGRIERLDAHLADTVKRGDIVAWLDSAEYEQRVAQAQAELEVARANEIEAESALIIAERALERMKALQTRGVESESRLDQAVADQLAKKSRLAVTKASVTRATAALAAEEIRLGYTRVTANWPGEDEIRVVGERYVDEGETVAANEALLRIIRLDPITGVVFVAERDYARLAPGQAVNLTTDAHPGVSFPGAIERIAPIFRQSTRQARIELRIPNRDQLLKPGMFVRVTIELATAEDAIIVPAAALTLRDDAAGLFIVDPAGRSVAWHAVTVGIRDGDRIQVSGEGLQGRVVTLGQQLIDDGSAIILPDDDPAPESEATTSG